MSFGELISELSFDEVGDLGLNGDFCCISFLLLIIAFCLNEDQSILSPFEFPNLWGEKLNEKFCPFVIYNKLIRFVELLIFSAQRINFHHYFQNSQGKFQKF